VGGVGGGEVDVEVPFSALNFLEVFLAGVVEREGGLEFLLSFFLFFFRGRECVYLHKQFPRALKGLR